MIGNLGDDILNGGGGNDVLLGGAGSDNLLGGSGNDFLNGDDGNDQLNGEGGADQIFGSDGDDNIFGGDGADEIHGDDGEDTIVGGAGPDALFGENGVDVIFGGGGDDRIQGGNGDDSIFGQGGNDTINGNNGDDVLLGTDGFDFIQGGNGNDFIRGGFGNDRLFGENGDDRIFGDEGDDGLIGGNGGSDFLSGGADDDRVIVIGDDIFSDRTTEDAQLDFRNGSQGWTNIEIQVLDDAFARLQDEIGNTRLLRDTATDQPLVFIKENTIPRGIHLSQSELVTVTNQFVNSETGLLESESFVERRYSFADWNEFDAAENEFHVLEVPRDIALAWASTEGITDALPDQTALWDEFLRISDWVPVFNEDGSRNPNPNPEFYQISIDNQWFHLQETLFADELSPTNPQEDFASVWRLHFEDGRELEKVRLSQKISFVTDLFNRLEIF